MKKILITGANSYIGRSFENWMKQYPNEYAVDTIDMINDSWRKQSFINYDVVFHVAGIAHEKETKENKDLYYEVNCDLAFETAKKSKQNKVKLFILLSSMSVYGIENGVINKHTKLSPVSNYGKSKYKAEELISSLEDDDFKIAILRPPMIYGKGCKGNYSRISDFAYKFPFFPKIKNERSMLFIDNLCEFIKILIRDYRTGVFFPQNREYVCTSEMVKLIAEIHGVKIFMTKIFNPFIILSKRIRIVSKVFGNLTYEKSLSGDVNEYCIADFDKSIILSEK